MATGNRSAVRGRIGGAAGRIVALALAAGLLAACSTIVPGASDLPGLGAGFPTPSCGGIRPAIQNVLPCERLAQLAITTLQAQAPEQLARGVESIDVELADCPAGEVPQQVDCRDQKFAQMVRITFKPAPEGGPIEPFLTVAIDPVTGRIMGIVNPMIL